MSAATAPAVLDHLVYAAPDLAAAAGELAELTGVRPVTGGSHPGRGTRNCLLALDGPLGAGAYLELIGPDPEQPESDGPRWFGIDALTGPRLVTWAVRATGLPDRVARARAAGYDPGDAAAMGRRTPDGRRISWELTPPCAGGGTTPFLLDWGATPHPTAAGLPALTLEAFAVTGPDPAAIAARLAALGGRWPDAPAASGPAALTAVVRGPRGAVRLGHGAVAV
ncbi:VOC family protein [Streptomyces benahoarensis]|uniref:VOC family protein n=1 Tax=Streptomyces benahoarensis TaxID=2595054 RepID=A0A553Z6C9_9ACTN|nr:VOC family protein [Streptomyces benahoarensis]TSB25528.1 VOC family protein [Streptomyces benahoarensis]TSB36989.1 VOC family protein [Streptomyces benahoarensis]